jgi:hypothetical protein
MRTTLPVTLFVSSLGVLLAAAGGGCATGGSLTGGAGGESSTTVGSGQPTTTTGATGSTGTGTPGCNGAQSCSSPSECPATGTACLVPDCAGSCCNSTKAPLGTPCTDGGGTVCDGAGSCVAMHCTDGLKDADETDKDCGGSCPPCGDTLHCVKNADCASGVCDPGAKTCTPATCTDQTKNGNETDVDCGGPECDALNDLCAVGKACSGNGDCQSDYCNGGVCALRPDGNPCAVDGDCASGHCVGPMGSALCCNTACNGTCQACDMGETGQPNGTCANMTPGLTAPAGQCTPGALCGNTGKCAAGGTCEQVPNCSCGTNLALGATALMSSGGSGTYGPQNMNDGTAEGVNCNWAWISNSTTPSGAYFELDWASAQTIRSIYVDTMSSAGSPSCSTPGGRNIASGTVQWWNGASWVTATTFSGKTNDFQLDLPATVTTTKLRLYDVTTSPGNGNSILFEWHVYSGTGCVPPP